MRRAVRGRVAGAAGGTKGEHRRCEVVGSVHVQFAQNHNKRIAFCRRHCFAPLFAACLTARRVKVGFVHSHDCRACTNPTGVVWLQSDGE